MDALKLCPGNDGVSTVGSKVNTHGIKMDREIAVAIQH